MYSPCGGRLCSVYSYISQPCLQTKCSHQSNITFETNETCRRFSERKLKLSHHVDLWWECSLWKERNMVLPDTTLLPKLLTFDSEQSKDKTLTWVGGRVLSSRWEILNVCGCRWITSLYDWREELNFSSYMPSVSLEGIAGGIKTIQ